MSGGDVRRSGGRSHQGGTDFDLHGIVGVRLVDATEADVAVVRRQLGPLQRPLEREPDITVRFVDSATHKALTIVGVGESCYNDDGFFVQRGAGSASAKVSIPFAQIGHRPEIVCERGITAIPHLLAVINLTCLCKGVLPLHATAFTVDDRGVLVTGWSKAGKTESLLACMDRGAHYVGDEWIYLTDDRTMLGLPEPIRLWWWQLHQVPRLLQERSRRDRVRLAAWHRIGAVTDGVARLPGVTVAHQAAPVIKRQACLRVPPEELFGSERMRLRGRVDAVVLVENHESPDTTVEPIAGAEVASRMSASLTTERAPFMAHYLQFCYAFPHTRSEVVESAPAAEARLLARLFGGWTAARVAHPYPCDIAALGGATMAAAALCEGPKPQRSAPVMDEARS